MTSRNPSTPSRWAWALPFLAAGFVVACQDSLSVDIPDDTWGFVELPTLSAGGSAYQVVPEAFFFRGRLGGVPNSDFVFDSCNTVAYSAGGELGGVTYIDAGAEIAFTVGATATTLERQVSQTRTFYEATGGAIPFTPGDSVSVTVPGAVGGYPQSSVRAKTAEAFTINQVTVPAGTEAIQLQWTPASDLNSAMIVALRFASEGATTQNRQVLCPFVDDGVDSIPFRFYDEWASGETQSVVATRLRTRYVVAPGSAILGVVSTFQVPTPNTP
ncbi:MAG TPA: hypothetical protein VLE53_09080 [Gemmatimonadaceae bacterium]|nr:hypothetical protein [Gemmatimonadaceae bacterium]